MPRVWSSTVIAILIATTAIAVAVSKHRSRALLDAQQELSWERDRLKTEWAQLQLEEAALAAHGHVERVARERLSMQEPTDFIAVEEAP